VVIGSDVHPRSRPPHEDGDQLRGEVRYPDGRCLWSLQSAGYPGCSPASRQRGGLGYALVLPEGDYYLLLQHLHLNAERREARVAT
jgi:hypothetical protein